MMTGTPAAYFNEREHQICLVARMIEDARTYWVAGGGSPMASILLAKRLYAQNAVYVTEDGVVNPEPMLPLHPLMTIVSPRASYRALPWATFASEDRSMRLIGVSPFVTVDQVLAQMSFEPKMAPQIETLQTPTEEELAILRSDLDQRGQTTDVGKPVLRLDDGTFQFVEEA